VGSHVILSNPLEGCEILGPDRAAAGHRLLDSCEIPRTKNGETLDLFQRMADLIEAHLKLKRQVQGQ
jgi:hypothetical protein